jgi:hypothetical protein
MNFEETYCLPLLFNDHLNKVFLISENNKYTAPQIKCNNIANASKDCYHYFKNQFNIDTNIDSWNNITSLKTYNCKKELYVLSYVSYNQLDGVFHFSKMNHLIYPTIMWLIYMSIDYNIFGSIHNQIIFKSL